MGSPLSANPAKNFLSLRTEKNAPPFLREVAILLE